jgi:uncharacterized protein (DUF302 family)
MIRTLFAVIGFIALVAVIGAYVMLAPVVNNMDDSSKAMMTTMFNKMVKEKQSTSDAMMAAMVKEDSNTDPETQAMLKEIIEGVIQGGEPIDTMLSVMLKDFDPGAVPLYKKMMGKLLTEKDPASAMVYAVKADEGLTPEEVKDSMKSVATSQNMMFVSESPFYKQAEAVLQAETGQEHKYRHIAFLSFCDVRTGMLMADYNDAYTAIMPCTISVVEKSDGSVWLYAIDVDFMIYGGKEFPPEMKKSAISVRDRLRRIMEGGARGEF